MSAPSLRHNATWTVVGNLAYAASQLGILTVLAKLSTSVEVGRFAIALAVSSPIVALCMLQLRNLQATDFTDRARFSDYVALRLFGMCVALVIIVALAVSAYTHATALAIITVGFAKTIEGMSDIAYGLLQRHERMRRVALSQIAKAMLSLLAIAVGAYAGSVAWCGIALAAVWLLGLLIIDLPAVIELQGEREVLLPRCDARRLAHLAWLAFPLGAAFAMVTLINVAPRLILERTRDLADVGVFAASMTLILPGTMFVSALGQAASPRMAGAFARGEHALVRKYLRTLLGTAVVVGIAGVLAGVVLGRWGIRVLYSQEIADAVVHVPLIMVAGGLWCVASVFGCAAVATGRLRAQPVATAVSLVLTVAAAAYLVPTYGMSGAIMSAVISAAAMAALLAVVYGLRSDLPRSRAIGALETP